MEVIHTGPFGVNTLIVPLAEDKVFIVDPACCSFCNDDKVVSSWLARNKKVPVAVVLTHGHFDHIAGINVLEDIFPGLPVLIHKNDSVLIGSSGGVKQGEQLSYMGFEEFIPSVTGLKAADGFLENGRTLLDSLKSCGKTYEQDVEQKLEQWTVMHTPGHTMGCVCLYNKAEKTLISGDTLFYRSWGRTDLGGSEQLIRNSLKTIVDSVAPDTKVYPGHDYYGFELKDGI